MRQKATHDRLQTLAGPCVLALVVGLLLVGGLARPAAALPVFTPATFPRLILALPWEVTGATCTAPPTTHALPTATGSGTVTYTLDDDNNANTDLVLPDGLSFDNAAPALTGTPTAVTAATSYTLTATDGGDTTTASLTFSLEVVSEKAILERFYTATGGNGWTATEGWGSSISVCPGQLQGVAAADGRVSEILLLANKLTGSLPADLGQLTGLTKLHLPGNTLTGSLPADLGQLTSLQELYLHNNALTGTLDLSGLRHLTHLALSRNQLSSPPTVSGLSNLTHLYLNDTTLTNAPDLSGLSSLTELWLQSNRITNAPDVSGLSNLTHLNLQHNRLTSAPDVSGLSSLTRFWLYGNANLDLAALNQPPAISLAATPNPVTEGGVVQMTATLSAALGSEVEIKVWPVSDTANHVSDFVSPLLITLAIPAGDTAATIDISTVDDSQQESAETFVLALQVYPLLQYMQSYIFPPGLSDLHEELPHELQPGDTPVVTVTIHDNDGGGSGGGGGGGGGRRPRDDHGNSAGRATRIQPGGRTAGQFHTRSDVDYFTLTAPQAGVLVVETTGSTDTRATVWQDGMEIATAASGGSGQNFRLSTRVAAGEPVEIAVRGNGRQTGRYTLQTALVLGSLENPGPASFQSGLGVLSGWVCEAEGVTIEIEQEDGTVAELEAAYGTARADTEEVCGDTDTGFGLLFNWNLLGDGTHEVVALVDGVAVGLSSVDGIELGRATVTVTTLGEEFRRGLTGVFVVADFPRPGEQVHLVWQEAQQNFVLAPAQLGAASAPGPGAGGIEGVLENPAPVSYQSGIGVISGWVCEADEVVIEIDGQPLAAAAGTERADTLDTCGDRDNGFGLLVNWAEFGAGAHEVVALVDGVELSRATVTVTVVDEAETFVRGLAKRAALAGFPTPEETVTVEWQQSQQNFVITGVD